MHINLRIATDGNSRKIDDISYFKSDSNNLMVFDYDSLVIATGARSVIPKIKGIIVNSQIDNTNESRTAVMAKGLLLLGNYEDGIYIWDSIKTSKSCVIVGAGLIGVEMAHAFRKRGMEVTIVEMTDHVLPNLLEKDMAEIVKRELEDNGIRVILGEGVNEVVTSSSSSLHSSLKSSKIQYIERIRTTKNNEIATDLVLLSTGVKPNSEIAKEAGIELGVARAIKVDEHMRTNIADIFAAGDCATSKTILQIRTSIYL